MFARFSLCALIAALGLLGEVQAVPALNPTIGRRDADFMSVRTKSHKDHSGKGGDPGDKYFHESTVRSPHCLLGSL